MAKQLTLKSIKLVNYKGFSNHTVHFRGSNVLVGANNAGKSTALGALRLVVALLPLARRTNPPAVGEADGRTYRGWPITGAAIDASGFSAENLRHDFRPLETRIEVRCSSGVTLGIAWPEVVDPDEPAPGGMFYILPGDNAESPRQCARELVPEIGSVPTLTPLDDRESAVSAETLRRHQGGRRSSRYFRNTLHELNASDRQEFFSFVYEKTPELTNLLVRRGYGSQDSDFDFFYSEPDTGHEREIGWSGDGMQIWAQLLFHLWRHRDADVIILDEPDVFLHPDLQRRLSRIIFDERKQVIVATHSVEILAEAEPASALWIDRARRNAERPRSDGALAMMGRRLGSGFELGIGRALRSNFVLFVEGDDAPILAHLGRSTGRILLTSANSFATVPLGGFSRNWTAAAFTETMAALGQDVTTYVLLDSDLRSLDVTEAEVGPLRAVGAHVHVWRRRELENYLLVPAVIQRVAKISLEDVQILLASTLEELRDEAETTLLNQRLIDKGRRAERTVLTEAKKEFRETWDQNEGPISLIDAKAAIRSMNTQLQRRGARTLNPHALAKAMHNDDLIPEVAEVLDGIEGLASS